MVGSRLATPVLARLVAGPSTGVVRGVGGTTAYVDFDEFVVALTAPAVALMPNGIALARQPARADWPRHGATVRFEPGRLSSGTVTVEWAADRPPTWNPALPMPAAAGPEAVRARGMAILASRGIDPASPLTQLAGALVRSGLDPAAHDGASLLLRSLSGRDPELVAAAAARLIGRGPGLTPAGDDLLAAASATVAALAVAAGWTAEERDTWLAHALPSSLRVMTTALSATLLELAVAGQAIEPLHRLLALDVEGELRWPEALRHLSRIGHSTGRCYAVASGAAALLCTGEVDVSLRRQIT